MVWSPTQQIRLAIEKVELEKYFLHGVTWITPQHETKVEVLLKSNSDKDYKLRIYIPQDFPSSCPILVVVSPKVLHLKNGSRLPQASSPFHTLEDTYGFHRICHFYPADWTQDITLYQVFMKGRVWIEAYEGHLDTGMNMDAFLREQNFTPARQRTVRSSRSVQRGRGRHIGTTTPGHQLQEVSNNPMSLIRRQLAEDAVSRRNQLQTGFTSARNVESVGQPLRSNTPRNPTAITNARRGRNQTTTSNARANLMQPRSNCAILPRSLYDHEILYSSDEDNEY